MRHRRTRRHPGRRAGAAGGGPGAPPDRRADLDAHPRRHPARARAAADLRRGGRRPVPRRDRPLRRHHRHRLPRGAHRQRLLHRHGPVRRRHVPATLEERVNTVATHVRARARRQDGALARRVLLHRLAARGDWCRSRCRTGTTCTSTTTCSPRCGSAVSPTSRSPPCWSTTRARSSPPRAATDGRRTSAPIGTQVSALAAADPDAPAVTCEGRTLTRAELDASTNRLARAYAERGVGVGDYVTIVLPNSIEWMQAVWRAGSSARCPQPLSARLPDAEFEGILDLRPRALIVGRDRPARRNPQRASGFHPGPGRCPTRRCPRRCPRCGSRWPPAAAPDGPS